MKNFREKIDIILPNYNSEDYIDQTLKSVINQSYKNWKLFIIDDGSNLKTRNILKKYRKNKKIKIIYLSKNHGAAYCRNLALKKSKSKFIAFIDSDDIWQKRKLETQIKFMIDKKKHFTYTFYKTIGLKKLNVSTPLSFSYSSFIRNTSIATSTMMVSREIVRGLNFTDTKICEDYFFKCKMLKKTKHAHAIPKYLTKYRIRFDSLQSNKLRNLYWIWKINYEYNKLSFVDNLISIFNISLNSLFKYGLK